MNAKEPVVAALDDAGVRARTDWLKGRLAAGETLDDILVAAFATVREAAKRTLGQRHFDVQLLGATEPVYLNALAGKGVHVITVNDYLAARDSGWMGQIYTFLGLTVGCIQH